MLALDEYDEIKADYDEKSRTSSPAATVLHPISVSRTATRSFHPTISEPLSSPATKKSVDGFFFGPTQTSPKYSSASPKFATCSDLPQYATHQAGSSAPRSRCCHS